MKGLAHLLHRHTTAARADAGDIVLCHRRSRTDAHIRPTGHDSWTCLHDITFDELAELIRAGDSLHGDRIDAVIGAERLLYVANAIRIRRQAGA